MLKRAEILLCSSQATLNDCAEYGFESDRLRHVPLGVSAPVISQDAAEVRRRYGLNGDYLLFVGTLEPRKNLTRLVEAIETLGDSAPELVVVGATGWGEIKVSQKQKLNRCHESNSLASLHQMISVRFMQAQVHFVTPR